MGILRKVGQFTGTVLRKVGDVGGTVLRTVNTIAQPFKPALMSNPIGMGLVKGLDIATDAAKIASVGGRALLKASAPSAGVSGVSGYSPP